MHRDSLGSCFKNNGVWVAKHDSETYSINPINLHFYSGFIEMVFKREYIDNHINLIRWVIRILFALMVFWVIFEGLLGESSSLLVGLRIFTCILFLGIVIYTTFNHYHMHFIAVTWTICLFVIILKFVLEVSFAREGGLTSAIAPMVMYVLLNPDWMKINYLNFLHIILMVISIAVYGDAHDLNNIELGALIIYYFIMIVAITIICATIGYWLERGERNEFKIIRETESEFVKSQNVLGCLLPQFVKDRVKDGVRYIAEEQGEVTVIFCDIVDFDIICDIYTPKELTDWID
jgi:hypothetical protein